MTSTAGRGGGGVNGVKVRVPKMAELVAAQLRRKIVRGELAEGEALPAESALMAEFAVSRPTLREAFRVLESESLINVRRGARGGARVQVPEGTVAARYAGWSWSTGARPSRTSTTPVRSSRRRAPVCWPSVARTRTWSGCGPPSPRPRGSWTTRRPSSEPTWSSTPSSSNWRGMRRSASSTAWSGTSSTRRTGPTSTSTPASPENVRANRRGFRAHGALVDLVAARRTEAAEELWRLHLQEAEDYLLQNRSMTTVLDLLG